MKCYKNGTKPHPETNPKPERHSSIIPCHSERRNLLDQIRPASEVRKKELRIPNGVEREADRSGLDPDHHSKRNINSSWLGSGMVPEVLWRRFRRFRLQVRLVPVPLRTHIRVSGPVLHSVGLSIRLGPPKRHELEIAVDGGLRRNLQRRTRRHFENQRPKDHFSITFVFESRFPNSETVFGFIADFLFGFLQFGLLLSVSRFGNRAHFVLRMRILPCGRHFLDLVRYCSSRLLRRFLLLRFLSKSIFAEKDEVADKNSRPCSSEPRFAKTRRRTTSFVKTNQTMQSSLPKHHHFHGFSGDNRNFDRHLRNAGRRELDWKALFSFDRDQWFGDDGSLFCRWRFGHNWFES